MLSSAGRFRHFLTFTSSAGISDEVFRAPYLTLRKQNLRRLAMSPDTFTADLFFLAEGEEWKQPAGAFKRCGGPT
jgi:hypothetical protein